MIIPEYEYSGLRKIVEWVELIHHILPVEISQYGLRKRSSRFSIALANKIGLSHYTSNKVHTPENRLAKIYGWSRKFLGNLLVGSILIGAERTQR